MYEERFVDVDGTKPRYLEAGTGEPMLLVHGGNMGMYCLAEDWEPVIDPLAERFRVVAVDKLGCGFTDNPPTADGYLIGSIVDHLHRFLGVLGIDAAHLMGHSRGGYAVTRLALEHPGLARSLTIVDSSSLMTAPNPIYLEWDRQAAGIDDPRDRVRYLVTVNSWSGDHVDDHFVDQMAAAVQLPKTQEAARLQAEHRARFDEDLVARQAEVHDWIKAGAVTWPTLVMWGYDDPSATMERCGVPCMDLVLPNVAVSEMHILNRAGHYCYREQPAGFADTVTGFLARTTAA